MYVDLKALFWLCLICIGCWHWWYSLKVKDIALRAAKAYCKDMDVQLLDDSIYLRGFWLRRDETGRFRIWRSYLFDFTANGEDRARGRVVLLGYKVTSTILDPHRI